MVDAQLAAEAQQVRQTRLMQGVAEVPIGRPAVAHEHAGIVGAQDARGLGEPPAPVNRVDRGLRGREGPQPMQDAADLPTRFIWRHYRAPAHRGAQGRICRLGLASRPMERPRHRTPRHCQAHRSCKSVATVSEDPAVTVSGSYWHHRRSLPRRRKWKTTDRPSDLLPGTLELRILQAFVPGAQQ
jgi:hypothetical protein